MESNETAQAELVMFFKILCDENRLKMVECWHSTFVRARSARSAGYSRRENSFSPLCFIFGRT